MAEIDWRIIQTPNIAGNALAALEAGQKVGRENAVRAAYNHAQHIIERTAMMQAWADYLDNLRRVKD